MLRAMVGLIKRLVSRFFKRRNPLKTRVGEALKIRDMDVMPRFSAAPSPLLLKVLRHIHRNQSP